jgi:hypothetical protein
MLIYILPFFPLPPSRLRSSATCSNPVSDPNQISYHLTIIRCSFALTFRFRSKLIRDHPLTYSYSFWSTLTIYALVSAFWSMSPIYITRFWTLLTTTAIYHLFTSNQILVWFKPLALFLDFHQHRLNSIFGYYLLNLDYHFGYILKFQFFSLETISIFTL